MTNLSRGCFRSTTLMARVPGVRASATPSTSTLNLVIPDKGQSSGRRRDRTLDQAQVQTVCHRDEALARARPHSAGRSLVDLTAEQQSWVIEGDEKFLGVRGFFEYLERKKYKLHVRVFLSRYRGYTLCSRVQRARACDRGAAGEACRQRHLPRSPR